MSSKQVSVNLSRLTAEDITVVSRSVTAERFKLGKDAVCDPLVFSQKLSQLEAEIKSQIVRYFRWVKRHIIAAIETVKAFPEAFGELKFSYAGIRQFLEAVRQLPRSHQVRVTFHQLAHQS